MIIIRSSEDIGDVLQSGSGPGGPMWKMLIIVTRNIHALIIIPTCHNNHAMIIRLY